MARETPPEPPKPFTWPPYDWQKHPKTVGDADGCPIRVLHPRMLARIFAFFARSSLSSRRTVSSRPFFEWQFRATKTAAVPRELVRRLLEDRNVRHAVWDAVNIRQLFRQLQQRFKRLAPLDTIDGESSVQRSSRPRTAR